MELITLNKVQLNKRARHSVVYSVVIQSCTSGRTSRVDVQFLKVRVIQFSI